MHPTDRDFILAADGELDARRKKEVRDHTKTCSLCRARQAELEGAFADYVRAYRRAFDPRPRRISSQWNWAQWIPLAAAVLIACLALARGPRGDLSIPKNTLTPGETRKVTLDDVCRVGRPGAEYVSISLRQEVFREYGIRDARPNAYEVDYLITPELGGARSIRNLWPQPYSTVWNARVKDELEERLHDMVCYGTLDLATAQREIATDWIAAYKKYFNTDRPR
jgi:hypothetical protein